MDKTILITGHGMNVVDQIFDRVDFSYIIQYSRSDVQELQRYLYRLCPKLIIISLENEDERFYSNIYDALQAENFNSIPIVIIGSSEDCMKFANSAKLTPSEKLTRPLSTEIIEETIKKYFMKDNVQSNEFIVTEQDEELWKSRYEQYLKDVAANIDINQHVSSIDEIEGINLDDSEELDIDNTNDIGNNVTSSILLEDDTDNKHVLIVDDDDTSILKLLKGYLDDFYDVAVAISGSVALKFLEMHKTDLIILDYKMPEMSGSEVVSRLRTNPKLKNIPIIFLTGVSDAETVRECLKLKPQGYALKPMKQDKLIEMVSGIIGL